MNYVYVIYYQYGKYNVRSFIADSIDSNGNLSKYGVSTLEEARNLIPANKVEYKIEDNRFSVWGNVIEAWKDQHTIDSLFQRVRKITSCFDHNFKHLVEEVGEISTESLIEEGVSYKAPEEGVSGEACDALICILAIFANKTNNLQEMLNAAHIKLMKWEKGYLKRKNITELPNISEFAVGD